MRMVQTDIARIPRSTRGKSVVLAVSALIGLSASTTNPQVLHTLISPSEEAEGFFGYSVSGIGDANGDGYDDVVVGAIKEDQGSSPTDAGRAYVFDGQTGRLIYRLVSPNEDFRGYFGHSVSGAGDVNKDGCGDVLIGAPNEYPGQSPTWTGRAYIFDGYRGSLLHMLASPNQQEYGHFGISVAGAGDVDGNGFDDVVIGAYTEYPGESPQCAGRAYIYNGETGQLIHTLHSPNENYQGYFGFSVSTAGDVNDDGCDDVMVGAPYEASEASPVGAGRAHIFDGQTGEILHTLLSPHEEMYGSFGNSVADIGDINGNGFDDVLVGAYREDPGSGPTDAGRAYIFDGQTGSLLLELISPNEEISGYFGCSVSGAGDLNLDGLSDVIVGAFWEDLGSSSSRAGRSYVFDGQTGNLLHMLVSPNEEFSGYFGHSVSGAGDLNGDGSGDVVVGAYLESPGSSPTWAGRAYVFSGALIPVELTGFTANVAEGAVILRWSTLSEHENFGFHVYRSQKPDETYNQITDMIIPGAGTSSIHHDYSYMDQNIIMGKSYSYKLADIDLNGSMTSHGPVTVNVSSSDFVIHEVYPNPFRTKTAIHLDIVTRGPVLLDIYNMAGELVRTLVDEELETGAFEIVWDGTGRMGDSVSPGFYTYRIQQAMREYSGKLIRIR